MAQLMPLMALLLIQLTRLTSSLMSIFFAEVRKSLRLMAMAVLPLLLAFGVIGVAWCRKLGDCGGFLAGVWEGAGPDLIAGAITFFAAAFFFGGWGAAARTKNPAARVGYFALGIIAAGGVWVGLLAAYVWLDGLRK